MTNNIGPEDMSPGVGHTITGLVLFLPAAVLIWFGLSIGTWYTAGAFVTIWLGIFLATSLRFVRKRRFHVIERFGKFWDIKFAGLRIMIPWVDAEVMMDDFLQKSVQLYEGMEIDFADGSAGVKAAAWYQIGNPHDVDGEVEKTDTKDPSKTIFVQASTREEKDRVQVRLREQVRRYTYRVRSAEHGARVAEIFQGAFRPLLEGKEITAVQGDPTIADTAVEASKEALEQIGVYPFPGKGIILRDIVLPPTIVEFRQQKQKGQAAAEEAKNRARALWEPLQVMKEGLRAAGMNLSDDEIKDLYLRQRGLETVQGAKANLTFVSRDMSGVLVQVGAVGEKKGDAS